MLFYSGSVIKAYDRRIKINPTRRQSKIDMAHTLNSSWRNMGISRYLQMDNILSLRGSNQYPNSLGLVMRLCLYLGIQPMFIPIREPWRNGIVPGRVHLIIRLIRSNRILYIFGEEYIMPQDVMSEYVWATIDTGKEVLSIYHDSKLIVEYPYLLPKSSIDLSRFDL